MSDNDIMYETAILEMGKQLKLLEVRIRVLERALEQHAHNYDAHKL